MKLNFTYSIFPKDFLHRNDVSAKLTKMKLAGVETIYIGGYFYGTYDSSPEEIYAAKGLLEGEGFSTGIINVPLGHGGNALDPSNPDINLNIGHNWQMTMDQNGYYRSNTTCIDDVMIADTAQANRIFFDMGFRKFFNDDDLRFGHWGRELQGCFCDRCMEEFQLSYNKNVSRTDVASMKDPELVEKWEEFQCQKIARFLLETTPKDAVNGIMVMHNGDRRHGIDIQLLRKQLMPDNLVFRVGEGHFDDNSFTTEEQYDSVKRSIMRHLALVGDNELCYSETTVYPANALSPEKWIYKMKLEISCGLRNLYLMSGTWLLTDPYWNSLIDALPQLRELAESTPIPETSLPEFSWVW